MLLTLQSNYVDGKQLKDYRKILKKISQSENKKAPKIGSLI